MPNPRRVRNDATRRERILDATLSVIANHGVQGTTHRRIAEAAQVPLGSVTYHFSSLQSIIEEAFVRLTLRMSDRYDQAMADASTLHEACEAVATLILGPDFTSPRDQKLIYELYAYASGNDRVTEATHRWLGRSRETLAKHFSQDACRAVDALIEGWLIHQTFEQVQIDHAVVTATVMAIAERLA